MSGASVGVRSASLIIRKTSIGVNKTIIPSCQECQYRISKTSILAYWAERSLYRGQVVNIVLKGPIINIVGNGGNIAIKKTNILYSCQ